MILWRKERVEAWEKHLCWCWSSLGLPAICTCWSSHILGFQCHFQSSATWEIMGYNEHSFWKRDRLGPYIFSSPLPKPGTLIMVRFWFSFIILLNSHISTIVWNTLWFMAPTICWPCLLPGYLDVTYLSRGSYTKSVRNSKHYAGRCYQVSVHGRAGVSHYWEAAGIIRAVFTRCYPDVVQVLPRE